MSQSVMLPKRLRALVLLGLSTFLAGPAPAPHAAATTLKPRERAAAAPASGTAFEENLGQTDASVAFVARAGAASVFLSADGLVASISRPSGAAAGKDTGAAFQAMPTEKTRPRVDRTSVRVSFDGANRGATARGVDELPGRTNYLNGRSGSITGVRSFRRVAVDGIYPGVDLVYYGTGRDVEYDFVVAPGADPSAIRLRCEGAASVTVDAAGDLVMETKLGAVRQHAPKLYQRTASGERREVAGAYRAVRGGVVELAVGAYDRSSPLVIDPIISYGTYLGGTTRDVANDVAADASGHAFVTGYAASLDYPTTIGAYQTALAGENDVFVTKLDAQGSAPVYSTYVGGAGFEQGNAIAVDAAGNAYVTGWTASADYPTTSAPAPANGNGDVFVTKLDASGAAIAYSVVFGSSGFDSPGDIAVDAGGAAHVVGLAAAADFPTVYTLQNFGGEGDGFYAVVDEAGSTLLDSTFLGGSSGDGLGGVAVDASGYAYVVGTTFSSDFPVVNAFQPTNHGIYDGTITKIGPGPFVVFSTYFGGSFSDGLADVAVDAAGNIYVAGESDSADVAVVNALQPGIAGYTDSLVAKFDPEAGSLLFSTHLGGGGPDDHTSMTLDAAGNVAVAGRTSSGDFPTANAIETDPDGGDPFSPQTDLFVTKITGDGSAFVYSTYLGGTGSEDGGGIAADASGAVYVATSLQSDDVPTTTGAFEPANPTGDASTSYVAKLVDDAFGCEVVCPPDVTVTANAHEDCFVFAEDLPLPTPSLSGDCDGVTARCVGPSTGRYVGDRTVLCWAEDERGIGSVCHFVVHVATPFGVCLLNDDPVHSDTFSIVVDPASPLYGFWVYVEEEDEHMFCGTADTLRYVPGHSLVAADRQPGDVTMRADVNFDAKRGTVRVADRVHDLGYVLKDRDTSDDPACH